jgi:opacity protein-like surface antigen
MHRLAFIALILLPLGLAIGLAPDAARANGDEKGDEKSRSGFRVQPYLTYEAGFSAIPNQNLTGADASGAGLWGRVNSDPGFTVGGAVGARLHDYLRAELNLSYRENDLDSMSVGVNFPSSSASGEISLFSALFNVIGDLDLGWRLVPYAGIGIGYGLFEIDAETSTFIQIDDDASVFAWNLLAGASFRYSETTEFSLGYRYLATTDPEINSQIAFTGPRRLDSEFDAHELVAGLRFNF